MNKLVGFGLIIFAWNLVFATADLSQISECVWDKYFTKADELRIKVDELAKKEIAAKKNKAAIQKEKEDAAAQLKKMRETKRAFDVLKKENFFNLEEGLKTTFPDEYEACQAE